MLTSLKLEVGKALFLRGRMSLLSNTLFVFHLLILKLKCVAYLLGIFYVEKKRDENVHLMCVKSEALIGTYCKKCNGFPLSDRRDC